MNHEPIQFLPVEKFWLKTKPARHLVWAFVSGVAIGALGAFGVAVLITFICRIMERAV